MKRHKILIGMVVGLCMVVSAGLGFSLSRVRGDLGTSGPNSKIRILFIGNSYTFYNNLPQLVASLAVSAHEQHLLETQAVTKGGATLKQHWQDGDALAAIRQGNWDYVVLQEHSTLGATSVVNGIAQINKPDDFYTYARLFDAEIKKVGARTLFFMTWARQNSPQSQAILAADYFAIANELHDQVVPVGLAWAELIRSNPSLILHVQDMSHPTSMGSYLAACVFYTALYQKSPVGLVYQIPGKAANQPVSSNPMLANLKAADALSLQRIAWDIVMENSPTPTPTPTPLAVTI